MICKQNQGGFEVNSHAPDQNRAVQSPNEEVLSYVSTFKAKKFSQKSTANRRNKDQAALGRQAPNVNQGSGAAAAGTSQDDNLKIISDNFEKSKSKGKKRKKIIDDDDFKVMNGENSQNPTALEGMVDTSQKPQSNNLEKTIMSLLHDDQKQDGQEQQAMQKAIDDKGPTTQLDELD